MSALRRRIAPGGHNRAPSSHLTRLRSLECSARDSGGLATRRDRAATARCCLSSRGRAGPKRPMLPRPFYETLAHASSRECAAPVAPRKPGAACAPATTSVTHMGPRSSLEPTGETDDEKCCDGTPCGSTPSLPWTPCQPARRRSPGMASSARAISSARARRAPARAAARSALRARAAGGTSPCGRGGSLRSPWGRCAAAKVRS